MNSLIKNSNSIIRSANLVKYNFLRLPKFSFFSLDKHNLIRFTEREKTFYKEKLTEKNSAILKINHNFFSDKKEKDNQPGKKPDEGNKEGNNQENKSKGSNSEEPENDPNSNKDDNQEKDKEKKSKFSFKLQIC